MIAFMRFASFLFIFPIFIFWGNNHVALKLKNKLKIWALVNFFNSVLMGFFAMKKSLLMLLVERKRMMNLQERDGEGRRKGSVWQWCGRK